MMKLLLKCLIAIAVWSVPCILEAQEYTDFRSMSQRLSDLSKEYPSLCSVRSLVRTEGGKDIFLITIGKGDRDNKPAIAILGGIEGNYLLGKELALGSAAGFLKNSATPEISSLLDKITFYILPDVSPDASEQYFSELRYERNINARPTDNDRDFMTAEDPYEDLNNDGMITLIRVSDPSGTFIANPDDERIMSAADPAKGQIGGYLVYTEGTDNDKDGQFNEDGEGGVTFNRNLTYNYEEFGHNAGLHPVSEPETRAVLDFLFSRFNVYATIAFGPQDNLGQPMKAPERPSNERRITSVLKSDETINRLVSDVYHEVTGLKGAPVSKNSPGNFMEWSYFHYGRYSFSTPGWWITPEKDKDPGVLFLKYAGEKNIDSFVPWKEIEHPDFPGKKTEVGGIRPFLLNNPAPGEIQDLTAKNFSFITKIAAMHPELEFTDIKVDDEGGNIFRLSLRVHNKGMFATCPEIGDRNMWTRIMRISLEPDKGQEILSGQKISRIQRLEGNSSAEFSWLLSGKGTVKLRAGAVNTGFIETSLKLN